MKFKILLTIVLLTIVSCEKPVVEIKLTTDDIQEAVEKHFPYEKNLIIAKLELINPNIKLMDGLVHYRLDINFNMLSETFKGDFEAAGKIYYNKTKKAFYLNNFQILSINIQEVNEKYREKVTSTLNIILNNYFEDFAVYRLKESDYKQNLTRMFLQEVQTVDDYLLIRLSI